MGTLCYNLFAFLRYSFIELAEQKFRHIRVCLREKQKKKKTTSDCKTSWFFSYIKNTTKQK